MSLEKFLNGKKSLKGFKEEKDPDIVGLNFDIIKQEHENGVQMAEPCCIPEMHKNFGWMRGNQNCWTGFANRGKTQFTLFMMVIKSIHDGWKWTIWSPEMRKANFVDGKVKVHYNRLAYEIMATLSGKTPFPHVADRFKIPMMTIEEKEFWYSWIDEHFIFLQPKEKKAKDVLDSLRRVYENYGVDGHLIDPYKNITPEPHTRDDQHLSMVFDSFMDMAITTNTVMNWIAHPKSGISQITQVGNESKATVCSQYHLSGGAAWDNSMDGIYSIHRPNILNDPTDPAVEFWNLKERDQLLVAEKGTVEDISFNIKTRRYLFNGRDIL